MIPDILKKNVVVFSILLLIIYLIILLHFNLHPERIWNWDTSLYYLDEKITFGAYFSVVVNFMAGFQLLYSLQWSKKIVSFVSQLTVGLFLLLLSFDEYFELHEYYREVIVANINMGIWYNSLMQSSWVFTFSIFILGVFALIITFIVQQKSYWVRFPVIIAMLLYGLILMLELKGGSVYGEDIYIRYVGWEEGLEMLSAALFLFAILNKISLELTSKSNRKHI